MSTSLIRTLALAVFLFGLLVAFAGRASALQSATTGLDLVSPAACPSSGCAAGQRLDFAVNFNLTQIDPNRSPNVQVCVFAPVNWSAEKFNFVPQGTVTTRPYTFSISQCNPAPNGYYPTGGAVASLPAGSFGDEFSFSFRLGTTATDPGAVLVEIFEKDLTGTWVSTNQSLKALTVAARSAKPFVANDTATCATNSPCYINSLADLASGIGTGLKDAIDASPTPATLTIIGTYTIKQNTVEMNQPHILQGNGAARITYSGSTCTQPMLKITAGVVLEGLSIDDGSCSGSANRDLVVIESSADVRIERSDLLNGNHALQALAGNTAAISLSSSHIFGNAGYAILLDSANTGVLNAYANNLAGNRAGVQVECHGAAKGTVDHNFWGAGLLVAQGASHCTAVDPKRLGAPILHNSLGPGTQALPVTVGQTTHYAFNNAIGFQRTGTGSDFGLMIVNHGQGGATNVPFTPGQLGDFNACSNYWDVFLTDATLPTGDATLELLFKYYLSSACIAAIESPQFCGQISNISAYPLWWYDLSAGDWKTTGSGGSPTYCRPGNQELQVSISGGSNRPAFGDLARQPFVVGLPNQPVDYNLSIFTAQPGDTKATIDWTTTREVSLAGFYIQRSTTATTGFATLGTLVPRKGTNGGGASYQYAATGLTNNTPYYFRLLIVGLDGRSRESTITNVTPFPSTPTPTSTRTVAPIVPTLTYTNTLRPTSTYTFYTNTATRTKTLTPTTPFQTVTITRTITATSLTRSVTSTPGLESPTITLEASTALAETRAARTAIALLSATPTPTPTPPESERPTNPLTIVMAVLALTALGGGAFFLIREQRLSS